MTRDKDRAGAHRLYFRSSVAEQTPGGAVDCSRATCHQIGGSASSDLPLLHIKDAICVISSHLLNSY